MNGGMTHLLRAVVVVVQPPSPVQLFMPHGLQHARLPCPSPSPGVCPSSCPLIIPLAYLQGVLSMGEVECPLSKQAWRAQILAKRCNVSSVNWADITLN